jgi:predicted metal-dependent enzyme (double-stranded beta helix superfamily)
MFEVDQFVADCRATFAADSTHKAICEVLARAMSEPAAVLRGLGEPNRAEIRKLFHSDSLTILNVVWAPDMMVMPHNHRMWAVIGIYSGREDNIAFPAHRTELKPLAQSPSAKGTSCHSDPTLSIRL